MINQTSLALMKEHALILPVSAGPIKFTDLEAALRRRPTLAAVVDTWPAGCWHFPNASCGAPLGMHMYMYMYMYMHMYMYMYTRVCMCICILEYVYVYAGTSQTPARRTTR